MASLRRRMQPGSRVLLSPQPPLCRSAHRRRLVLPARRRTRLRAGLLGDPCRHPAREAGRGCGSRSHRTGPRLAPSAARAELQFPVRLRRLLYDPVRLQLGLENHPAQILVRLHSERVFYFDPEDPEKKPVGRPFRHGKRFDLKDPATWPQPATEHHSQTGDYGTVRVRAWSGLHPKTRRAAERYGSESAAVVRGSVVLVEVERLPSGERRRRPKALWLWWHGEGGPDLDLLWRSYCRRFSIEHAIRLIKERLGWVRPKVRHPEQADRWTWLVLAAYAQLLSARGVVADRRLLWEKPLAVQKLTPYRVLRTFVTLVPLLGTPAEAPKPRGRSPGRSKGSLSGPARRYPGSKKLHR